MDSLHSGKAPPVSAPSVRDHFEAAPDRPDRDAGATTLLLALLASQMRSGGVQRARQQDVTVLFCDIADYCRLAERAGPRSSHRLVNEVMERVTACIDAQAGTVVDFYGDGVLVMWNAPKPQGDHAARACYAALAIQGEVPRLANVWSDSAGTPLKLRCTVNTGPALVGNMGTRRRAKYGAVGHSINLAHRLQIAGKFFGLPILLTAATNGQLKRTSLSLRRLGWARLAGLTEPTELYELHAEEKGWASRRDAYEKALALFEARQWHDACRSFQALLDVPEGQLDLAGLQLLGRAIECLKAPPAAFDAAWELTGR